MADLYSIRCYYNSGFNAVDRPANLSVLDSLTYTDFPSNYLRQNYDLTTTRVKATWQQICSCDYVRIGTMYYIVSGIEMLSDMTAELSLVIDPILSMGGVSAIVRLAGWTERAHVATANDTLFGNTLAEPWAPSQPLAMDGIELIGPVPGEPLSIVLSTVDLSNITHTAEVYETASSSAIQASVTIPKIPEATSRCTFGVDGNNFVYPAGSFYDYDASGIPNAINDVRSLGIDSAIVSAYQIPKNFTATLPGSGVIGSLVNVGVDCTPSSSKNFRYGSTAVNNAKVYAMYNVYTILSACSGDRAEWKAEDLYSGGAAPTFRHFADLSPSGRPYIQPKYFHGAQTALYQEAIKGEDWYRLPFAYTGASGSLIQGTSYNRNYQRSLLDTMMTSAETIVGIGSKAAQLNVGGALETAYAGAKTIANQALDRRESAIQYQTGVNIVAPQIAFPQAYGAQAYLGNVFYLYRVRLSDNDMLRADRFFTQYGYSQDKKFDVTDMTNRSYFNYVKTRDADVYVNNVPLRIRQLACDVLNRGVRLWHIVPNANALDYNP